MKTFRSIALFSLLLTLFSGLQLPAQTVTTLSGSKTNVVKIKTSGECEMCKAKIEKEVSLMKGVKSASFDIATKTVTVVYNANKTSPDKIRKAISEIGYDADDVK